MNGANHVNKALQGMWEALIGPADSPASEVNE